MDGVGACLRTLPVIPLSRIISEDALAAAIEWEELTELQNVVKGSEALWGNEINEAFEWTRDRLIKPFVHSSL